MGSWLQHCILSIIFSDDQRCWPRGIKDIVYKVFLDAKQAYESERRARDFKMVLLVFTGCLSINPKGSFCKKKTPARSSQPVGQHKTGYDEWIFSITVQPSMVWNRKAECGNQYCEDHQNPYPSIVILKNMNQFHPYLKEYKWADNKADDTHVFSMP